MRLSIGEILDYKDCPQMYKFKYVDLFPERKTIKDHFGETLRQTITYHYFCMIDKREKSLDNLFKKWEMLWFTDEMENTFTGEEIRIGSNDAIELLRNFYEYNKKENVFPVAVDFKYDAMFMGDTNLHIGGCIDLIKIVNDKTKDRETDLVFFTYAKTIPNEFMVNVNLRYTLASYAFRRSFESKETNIISCNIGKKKSAYIKKTGSDFNRAQKIVYNIANGIENRIFYPSDNPITCNRCKYRVFCMNEKAMEDKGNAICKRDKNC